MKRASHQNMDAASLDLRRDATRDASSVKRFLRLWRSTVPHPSDLQDSPSAHRAPGASVSLALSRVSCLQRNAALEKRPRFPSQALVVLTTVHGRRCRDFFKTFLNGECGCSAVVFHKSCDVFLRFSAPGLVRRRWNHQVLRA